jgi:hypothetical protein
MIFGVLEGRGFSPAESKALRELPFARILRKPSLPITSILHRRTN